MLWIRRCLALVHLVFGFAFLFCTLSYTVLVLTGLPQLLKDAPRTNLLSVLVGLPLLVLPLATFGAWMLTLARWLWSGHRWLCTSMLVTHPFLLLLGLIAVHQGFDEIAADQRSTTAGGGLIGSLEIDQAFRIWIQKFRKFSPTLPDVLASCY